MAHTEQNRILKDRTERVPDWIWEIDPEGVVTYSNGVVTETLGYDAQEIIGRQLIEFIPEEEVEHCKTMMRDALTEGRTIKNVATTFYTKDNLMKTIELSCVPLPGTNGSPVGLRGIARDITEHLNEQHLAEQVLGHSPVGVFILQNDQLVYVNPQICELMGYGREEVLNTPVWRYVHPDDMAWLADHQKRRLAGEDVSLNFIARGITKSGDIRYYDLRIASIPYKAQSALLVNAVDITSRKEAEDQLRKALTELETVFHAFPDVYFWLDTEGTVLEYHASDPSELYAPPEEFLGKKMQDVLPPEVGQKFAEALPQVEGCATPVSMEYALKIDDTDRYFEARLLHLPENQILVIVRNITDRYRAVKSVTESREMLELVLSNIPQYVFWKDTNLVYLGCNHNFARAAGIESPEQVIGKTDYDLGWTKEQVESYRSWDRRVISENKPAFNIIESQLTADGTEIWVDTTKVPLHNADGEVVGVLGTYEDITERLKSERALQEAEAKYRSLVEETMVGVYMIQNDRFVYANPRMLEIFGAREEELVNQPPLQFVAPQDRALVAESLRKRFSGEVKTARYAFKAQRVDKTPVDVEVHTAIVDYLGKPAVIGSLLDITERKRYTEALQDSEERYRRLFEYSPDMVLLLSAATGAFIGMNPAVTHVLGYAPYDVLGKNPGDISPEFQPNGKSSHEEAVRLIQEQAGGPAQRFEWILKKKDGTLVECEIGLVSYKLHGEELIQAIVRDVTERKQAEERRRSLEQELDRQKKVFYRDTILTVTGGKLDVCDYADVEPFVVRSSISVKIEDTSRVGYGRHQTKKMLDEFGLTGDRLDEFMVGVGEAITNAVKHGVRGTVYVGHDDALVWTVVADQGGGIESLILPRAVLLRGFSTKPSLGLGYSIMLDVSDRMLLSTGPSGTNVVLIKDKVESTAEFSELLPDTWDNIPG